MIEGIAIPLKSLQAFDMQISSADPSANGDIITNFFAEVQLPVGAGE